MGTLRLPAAVLAVLLLAPQPAAAGWDLSLFVGRAYPTDDDRLVLRVPAVPPVEGLDIQASGTPELRADGGPVFGGALAWEVGVLGLEGRLDITDVGLDLRGATYNLRATAPPLTGVIGTIAVDDGRFDADLLRLLSLNVRLRTPGPVSLIASGGLSYLPGFDITGSAPLRFELGGVPALPGFNPQVRIRVAPGESANRAGVNAGAGLRFGGRVAVFAEGRVFYFKEYELSLTLQDTPPIVNDLLSEFDPIRFRPVIVNAIAGLSFRF